MKFFKDDQEVLSGNTTTLTIDSAAVTDAGTYTCEAGCARSTEVTVTLSDTITYRHCTPSEAFNVSCPTVGPPYGSVLNIVRAVYGRLSPTACGHDVYMAGCGVHDARVEVAELCNGKTECLMMMNDDNMNDVCPGMAKYSEIEYRCVAPPPFYHEKRDSCVSTGIKDATDILRVNCPTSGMTVHVLEANYGRRNKTFCLGSWEEGDREVDVDDCVSDGAMEYVQEKCEGRVSCVITVQEMMTELGDPCPHIHKYVEVSYSCQGHFRTCSPMDLASTGAQYEEIVDNVVRVSSMSLIRDDSGGQCTSTNFGFSPSKLWVTDGCAGQFEVCVDEPDVCIDGYFGHWCRFSCQCKYGDVCDKITGSCPSGCQDKLWGPGCQLEHACYYNDEGASVYGGKLPIADVGECDCPDGRFGNNCEEECDCYPFWMPCHSSSGICAGYTIVTTNVSDVIIEIISKPDTPIFPGNEVSMKCVNVTAVVGREVIEYSWRRSGTSIARTTENIFTIVNFNETNIGKYSCVMDFDDGSQSASQDIDIELDETMPLMMSKFSKIPTGTPMKLQCVTKNHRHNFYEWFLNGEIIQTGPNKWYRLKQFREVNQGNYSCSASDAGLYYEQYSDEVQLTTIPRNSLCKCLCPQHVLEIGKMTDEQLGEKVKEIVKELIVKTDNLTATIRKKKSSDDKRATSVYVGYDAIVIYVIVFGSILLLDLVSLVNWMWQRRVQRITLKRWNIRQQDRELQDWECLQIRRRGIALSEI